MEFYFLLIYCDYVENGCVIIVLVSDVVCENDDNLVCEVYFSGVKFMLVRLEFVFNIEDFE